MKDRVNVLFCGGLYPEEMISTILNKCKSSPQMAANAFQWGLVKGFDDNLEQPVTIMNELFIGSYPKNYKDAVIRSTKFSHTQNAHDVNLGFINIAYIKQFLRPFGEKKYLKRWLTENPNGMVFIYALSYKTIRIARFIKSISNKTKIIVSVNDLPEHIMKARENNPIVKLWKKYQFNMVYSGLKFIDGYVLVARHQIDMLNEDESKCVVVEALTDDRKYEYRPLSHSDMQCTVKNIVYTGTLAYHYNIMNLVNAFMKINDDSIRLIICGDGEAKDEIIRLSEIDNRIVYKGVVPKHEVYRILQEAWVLVNPRNKGQSFTNYSFPIKIIDYLSAGRPIVCQKLEAIPDEYDEHLIYFDSSPDDSDLKNVLINTLQLSYDEIEHIGKSNIDFINKQKIPSVQVRKIIELYYSL